MFRMLVSVEVVVAKRRKRNDTPLAKWQAANPLLKWRLSRPPEGWNRSLLARQLGVSHTAVASWESGKRLPVIDAFAEIEKLTGIRTAQWMEWHKRKPKKA